MKRKSLWQRLVHGEPDFFPGQPVLVEALVYDHGFCRNSWERAKFLGRDDGGHAMVEFKDGKRLKLPDDQHIMG